VTHINLDCLLRREERGVIPTARRLLQQILATISTPTRPVAFNQWTHLMQRTFGNGGVAVYLNGVAVSRFNAGYTASTIAVTPTPDRNMYVGAGSGGGTNFFTGQLNSLKLGVYGDNTAQGGQNWGDFNLGVDNDYIANVHFGSG
jgi:hypothetical protein